MSTTAQSETNDAIKEVLVDRILTDVLQAPDADAELRIRDWEVLYFSSVFSVEVIGKSGRQGVFVKIPKADISRTDVLPQSEADRRLGEDEYASLQYLSRHWKGDSNRVEFVQPLAFYRDYNAIVTRRAYAHDLFLDFRRADIRSRVGGASEAAGMLAACGRLGSALSAYHRESRREQALDDRRFEGRSVIETSERNIATLIETGVSARRLEELRSELQPYRDFDAECSAAMTLKGFDLRNILTNSNGDIYLLDPGKSSPGYAVEDLARFIATLRILYWGSALFALGWRPRRTCEEAFLDGYAQTFDSTALDLCVIKELFKQWQAAYVALEMKAWPGAVKRLLGRTYVDRFYQREIRSRLARMRS